MFEIVGFGFSCIVVGAVMMGFLVRNTSLITKVDYNIELIGDGGVVKTLGTFSKYYWSTKSSEKDNELLCLESASIRGGNVPLDSIIMRNINVNYEVDYTAVFLSRTSQTVKPK